MLLIPAAVLAGQLLAELVWQQQQHIFLHSQQQHLRFQNLQPYQSKHIL
jgi:hypothetical protein